MAKKSSKKASTDSSAPPKMSRVAWASLVLSMASQASAFHSAPREPMLIGPIHSGSFSRVSTTRPSKSRREMSTSTTSLNYTNDSTAVDSRSWWNAVFHSRQADEQDNVDEYLEFLDRRYTRLHSSTADDEAKPFSALGWLRNGKDLGATAQQQEDSLYVLGVSGLASQKLLQKHHLVPPTTKLQTTAQPKTALAPSIIDVSPEDTASTRFIKRVLVPVIRRYVILQRAKKVFMEKQLQRARAFFLAAAKLTAKALVQGPVVTSKAILDIGGGKKSIAMTITALSTVLLLLRPVLQAVITETSVSP